MGEFDGKTAVITAGEAVGVVGNETGRMPPDRLARLDCLVFAAPGAAAARAGQPRRYTFFQPFAGNIRRGIPAIREYVQEGENGSRNDTGIILFRASVGRDGAAMKLLIVGLLLAGIFYVTFRMVASVRRKRKEAGGAGAAGGCGTGFSGCGSPGSGKKGGATGDSTDSATDAVGGDSGCGGSGCGGGGCGGCGG